MYDIDKMFLSRLYINSKGSTDFKEGTHEWHANRLINAYLAVLKDQDRSFQDLNGSIDNDTSFLTDVRDDLREGQKSKTLMPYSAYTLRDQSATKNTFMAGKFGIGPFALNNNMHILMQLYEVKFADNASIITELGLTNLGGFTDRYGKSILSWFSGLINAHVDAAKDPWIPELNVNKYTYNLVSMLTHAGLGKDTFYFTTQPIMRQLAIAYQNANGIYMNDQSKSKTKVGEEAEQAVIQNMIEAHFSTTFSSYNDAIARYWKTAGFSQIAAIKALFAKDCQVMRMVAKKHIGERGSSYKSVEDDQTSYTLTINGKDINITAFDVQMIVAATNEQFKPYAKALSTLVQHTKIDTKKQGKNLIEQRKYLQGVNELFAPEFFGDARNLFDIESLDNMYEGSYIRHQTRLATNLFRRVLGNQMIEATDKFAKDVDKLLLTVGNAGKDLKVLNLVQKAITAKIKSKYFFGSNGYCERYGIDPKSLVSGNSTIYDKLLSIKIMLQNDPKYKDLIDRRTGEPANYLLQALVSGNKYDYSGSAKFIQPLGFVVEDSFNPDDISQAWDDMLQDSKYPELQQFARELIVYAFITSGDNGGKHDLFKYVPNTWRLGLTDNSTEPSYADFMRQRHQAYVDDVNVLTEQDFEDIILNHWYEDSIVPKYNMYRKNKPVFKSFTVEVNGSGKPVILAAVDNEGNSTIKNPKKYIKIPNYAGKGVEIKGQKAYTVYKMIGQGLSRNGKIYPIYAIVDHKGSVFDKREKILQYWDEPSTKAETLVKRSLGNLLSLLDIKANTIEEAVAAIADYVLVNNTNLSVLVSGGLIDQDLADIVSGINRASTNSAQFKEGPIIATTVNYYDGQIIPDGNTVMVFGSNTQGIHGAGAAKFAKDMFGAQIGVVEGITGNAYALPTKDLEKSKRDGTYNPQSLQPRIVQFYKNRDNTDIFAGQSNEFSLFTYYDIEDVTFKDVMTCNDEIPRSMSPYDIVESIRRMYNVARQNPNKQFKVAYTNGLEEITLNGYIGAEMIVMFKEAGPIPSNVVFSRAWVSTGLFNQTVRQPEIKALGTYDMPGTTNNLTIVPASQTAAKAKQIGGIDTLRHPDANGMHFGNPFSHTSYSGVQKIMPSVKDAVTAFEQWLRGTAYQDIEPKRRKWILDQINSGALDNKPFVYYTNTVPDNSYGRSTYDYNSAPNHAHVLQKLVNELRAEQGGARNAVTEVNNTVDSRSVQSTIATEEEKKSRLIKKGRTEYEDLYQNMTDAEYEEWKKQSIANKQEYASPKVGITNIQSSEEILAKHVPQQQYARVITMISEDLNRSTNNNTMESGFIARDGLGYKIDSNGVIYRFSYRDNDDITIEDYANIDSKKGQRIKKNMQLFVDSKPTIEESVNDYLKTHSVREYSEHPLDFDNIPEEFKKYHELLGDDQQDTCNLKG